MFFVAYVVAIGLSGKYLQPLRAAARVESGSAHAFKASQPG